MDAEHLVVVNPDHGTYAVLSAQMSQEVALHDVLSHPCFKDADPETEALGLCECPCGRSRAIVCAVCGEDLQLLTKRGEMPCEHAAVWPWPGVVDGLAGYWGVE